MSNSKFIQKVFLHKIFFLFFKRGKSNNFLYIFLISIYSGYGFQKTIAANNETDITVGLTCGIVGWNSGKWEELSLNSGYLDAPWYTGKKGGNRWTENENNKASRIWSDKYFEKNSINWIRFTYFSDEVTQPPRTMVRHHRWKNSSSSQFTWTDDNRVQNWSQYIGNCSTENGIPDIGIPSEDIESLAKDIVLEVSNTRKNNYKMALNFLPKSLFATGGKAIQAYQNDLVTAVKRKSKNNKNEKVSLWTSFFAGNNSPFDFNNNDFGEYGNWSSYHHGFLIGITNEVGLNKFISIFGNNGSVKVDFLDQGGGVYKPKGNGFGILIGKDSEENYSHFLFSNTSFTGQHNRGLISVGDFAGGSARGNKSITSYVFDLTIGKRNKRSGFLINPEISGTWNYNIDHEWKESGGDPFNLHYGKYDDNFLLTEISIGISKKTKVYEKFLLTPTIKAGWIVDWDLNNKPATITNIKNNQTITIKPDEKNQHGLLIESSLKIGSKKENERKFDAEISYGIKLWDSNQKNSDWRTAIGVSYYLN